VYVTAEDWAANTGMQNRVREIYPSASGQRTPPKLLQAKMPWEFRAFFGGMTSKEDPACVATIPGGRVYGEGAIISRDDRLIGNLSRQMVRENDQRRHSIFRKLKLGTPVKVQGTLAVLAVQAGDVYWHWMFDLLPRIHLLQRSGISFDEIDYFVINKIRHAFQRETLELAGIPAQKIMECGKETHLEADEVIATSITRTLPAGWGFKYVRDLMLSGMAGNHNGGARRLYVTRADARQRRVSNEDEVFGYLRGLGFESVRLAGLSMEQQASLFAGAEIVVAPHGSGLTNLLFCTPKARVIELFSPVYVNPCYWALSNAADLEYYCLLGTGERPPEPPEGIDLGTWFFDQLGLDKKHGTDIHVDMASLKQILNMAGVS
jgi:capsular polysaccharide biosynthesis protein